MRGEPFPTFRAQNVPIKTFLTLLLAQRPGVLHFLLDQILRGATGGLYRNGCGSCSDNDIPVGVAHANSTMLSGLILEIAKLIM